MPSQPINLLAFDLPTLGDWFVQLDEKPFRATQLFRWIHRQGAGNFAEMTDLTKSLRDTLKTLAYIPQLTVVSEVISSDGTMKWVFDLGSGNAVETVYIPESGRGTLCISSQAGCAVGCRFCSTGHQGFSRNLAVWEIIAQLRYAEHRLRCYLQSNERMISNVVMMGMGEPLQNYEALLPALRIMLSQHAYGISRRRLTVSTSGVVPAIDRLAADCPVALAVSLHAPNDALRDYLVPLNRSWAIESLMQACTRYLAAAPRDTITFEYCMIDRVNDRLTHANELVSLFHRYTAQGLSAKINLIPFNPFPQSGLQPPPDQQVYAFARRLQSAGFVTTIRRTRGTDISAACGQLAGDVRDRTAVDTRMAKQRTQDRIFATD